MALKCRNAAQLHMPEQPPMKRRRLNAHGISVRTGMFLHVYCTGECGYDNYEALAQ